MEPIYINTAVLPAFMKKVQKMNNKARKLGMDEVTVTYGAVVERDSSPEHFGAYKKEKRWVALFTEVFMTGTAPVIGNHQLVATVDLTGSKPLVKKVPFGPSVDLTRFHDTDSTCDHCGYHRQRNDVLVLLNKDTDELIQIGRNCAADFFGTKDAKSRCSVSDWIDDFENSSESYGISGYDRVIRLNHLFKIAAAVVRTFGWLSHKDVEFNPDKWSTRSIVYMNLFPHAEVDRSLLVTPTSEDAETAKAVLAWLNEKFLSKDKSDCNDFERNVQAVVEDEGDAAFVRAKNMNYLIWGIAGYQRDLQKDAEARARKRAFKGSDFIGNVGDRMFVTATLLSKRGFDSKFGTRYLHRFMTEDGNLVVWWGTGDTASLTEVDKTYVFKGTVKTHETYNDAKQTVMSRLAISQDQLEDDSLLEMQ